MSIENNKLIAEFMGVEISLSEDKPTLFWINGWVESDSLRYHSDWNALWDVIDKIEDDERFDVNLLQYGTIILDNGVEIVNNVAMISFVNRIEHTYQAVVEFIKWYNQQDDSDSECDYCGLSGRFDDGSLWGVGKDNMESVLCTECLNNTTEIKKP